MSLTPLTMWRIVTLVFIISLSVLAVNGSIQRSKLAPMTECEAVKERVAKLEARLDMIDARVDDMTFALLDAGLMCE